MIAKIPTPSTRSSRRRDAAATFIDGHTPGFETNPERCQEQIKPPTAQIVGSTPTIGIGTFTHPTHGSTPPEMADRLPSENRALSCLFLPCVLGGLGTREKQSIRLAISGDVLELHP